MNKPLISMIMLTYNRKCYLDKAMSSFFSQTYENIELIVIDNGSTDDSQTLLNTFIEQDPRIRFKRIKKTSIASARNIGLDMAKGEYITFVDDDDYYESDMIDYLYELIITENADISVCGCFYDFEGIIKPFYIFDDVKVYNKIEGLHEFLYRRRYNSANPCKLFSRGVFNGVRYKEDSVYDDIHVMYKLFANADTLVSSGEGKYYFRRHKKNNSSFALTYELKPSQLNEYLEAFSERTRYLSLYYPEINEHVWYSELSYIISMIEKINRFEIQMCYPLLHILKNKILKNRVDFLNCQYTLDFEKEWIELYISK